MISDLYIYEHADSVECFKWINVLDIKYHMVKCYDEKAKDYLVSTVIWQYVCERGSKWSRIVIDKRWRLTRHQWVIEAQLIPNIHRDIFQALVTAQ